MSKKISISLEGKDLTLNFGIGRFYELFKEGVGWDLMTLAEGFDSVRLMEVVKGLVYAGYYAECKKNKVAPELSKEQIFDAVLDSESDWISEVFIKYTDSVRSNGVAPKEALSQLESQ